MIKRILIAVALTFAGAVVIYFHAVWQNNLDIEPVKKEKILASYEAAVGWIEDNRERILRTDNPALWWMVQRSAELTNDMRLLGLFDAYHKRYDDGQNNNYWSLLYKKSGWIPVRYGEIAFLDDYQQLLVYAITCDSELASIPLIRAQLDSSFCDAFPFRASCVTHQMIGLHLLQERECGDLVELAESMEKLQLRVRNQLVWDPRLLDQYLQRVLVLLETDSAELLKPVWLSRVINGIQEDGGFSSSQLILNLPGKKDLILTRNFIGYGTSESSFHTTVQGLFIMAHLLSHN